MNGHEDLLKLMECFVINKILRFYTFMVSFAHERYYYYFEFLIVL